MTFAREGAVVIALDSSAALLAKARARAEREEVKVEWRTGDLAVLHPDGYMEIRDRAKDIIVSGGENIASVEVEQALASHPAVLEAAVVAAPDEHWGEVAVAFVTLRDEANPPLGGLEAAHKLGYPILVRPSFVLGGRAMQIVYSDSELTHYMRFAVEASPERPVLVDKFLEDATEVDVDCITDVGHFKNSNEGTIVIGGMLEHIEFSGVHSGDAAMVLPPRSLPTKVQLRRPTAMPRKLRSVWLLSMDRSPSSR